MSNYRVTETCFKYIYTIMCFTISASILFLDYFLNKNINLIVFISLFIITAAIFMLEKK